MADKVRSDSKRPEGTRRSGAASRTKGAPATPSPTDKPIPSRSTLGLSERSLGNATKAFVNFSLSQFPRDGLPENYVPNPHARNASAVRAKQRERLGQQLRELPNAETQNPGMTISLPRRGLEEIRKSVPGLMDGSGKVNLTELLQYFRGKLSSTDLYSSGNPVLRRLTAETAFRSQAQKIIQRIKSGADASPASEPQSSVPAMETAPEHAVAGKRKPKS